MASSVLYNRYVTLLTQAALFVCYVNASVTLLFYILPGTSIESALWLAWHVTLVICLLAFASLCYFRIKPIDPQDAFTLLGNNTSLLIGHRGGALEAPENTLAAINLAAANGAEGVELDIDFTSDGVAVMIHDEHVDRTTNGTGRVCDMDYCTIKSLDAAAGHPLRSSFGHQPVPTLEEAVEAALRQDLVIFLDCKGDHRHPTKSSQMATAISALYNHYPQLYTRCVVCSFWPNIIYAVRRRDPKIVTALTHRPFFMSRESVTGEPRSSRWWKQCLDQLGDIILEWSHYAWLWYLCGNSLFLANEDNTSRFSVRFWEQLGIKVAVWTPNETADKLYFASLGCSVITDRVRDD